MDTIKATPVTWLWWPYIALGKLTMLDGDPGIGKSLLMTQVAASLSQGHPLPDQDGIPAGGTGGAHTTVMLSTEDGLADTLKPRLEEGERTVQDQSPHRMGGCQRRRDTCLPLPTCRCWSARYRISAAVGDH